MTRNFVCGFLFAYDRAFWDPDRMEYRIGPLCADAMREFAGYDSVVIWHAYPRIGADQRNQFDFFRDMPGGLDGVRDAVRAFHQQGVRVFLPYNPWDTGTAREKESDDIALTRLVGATEADGLFLDTMLAAPPGLRKAMDAIRPGVAFEPEGHPSIEEMQQCNASWAQWLQAYPEIGVLHLKWIEPRHMQHQIRRWDKSHQGELAAAWFNGSGVLVWENIFGYWNPWAQKTARRCGGWRPCGGISPTTLPKETGCPIFQHLPGIPTRRAGSTMEPDCGPSFVPRQTRRAPLSSRSMIVAKSTLICGGAF